MIRASKPAPLLEYFEGVSDNPASDAERRRIFLQNEKWFADHNTPCILEVNGMY